MLERDETAAAAVASEVAAAALASVSAGTTGPRGNQLLVQTRLAGGRTCVIVVVTGRITVDSSPRLRLVLQDAIGAAPSGGVRIDFTGTSYLDTSAVATLLEAAMLASGRGVALRVIGVPATPIRRGEPWSWIASFSRSDTRCSSRERSRTSRPRDATRCGGRRRPDAAAGRVLLTLPRIMPVVGKRRRWRAAVQQMLIIGADGLPMTAVMSFCIGYVLALQSAAELRRFSALQFVVDLVAVASHGNWARSSPPSR